MLTRRNLLVAAGAAVVGAVPLAGSATAALPQLDMESLIKAAQIDPRRPDTALTEGAKDSVLLVERALQAKGLLSSAYVDGHFGTSTIAAYAAYQRSLGYTGLDATGLPGPSSLRSLGEGRYTVVRAISPGSVVTVRDVQVNTRTRSMLFEAERLFGRQFSITQGSYSSGVGASAGTHDGGGALDLSVSGLSSADRTDALRRLRTVGFAAWLRTPAQGDWGYHIHAVALADTDQSTGAQNQAGDYYLGRNGLANRGADDGPAVSPKRTWEEYQRTL